MGSPFRFGLAAIAAVLLGGFVEAQPVERAELEALRAQVRALEAQLKAMADRFDATGTAAAPATPAVAASEPARLPAANVTITDRGYTFASTDAANVIRLRALLQFDSRLFFDDGDVNNDTFTLRRARLITEGALARRFAYQFVTEFGGSSVSILDANLSANFFGSAQIKAGKFKTPVGLEVLQPDAATSLTERSMLANFLPNRDLGIQLSDEALQGRIGYTVGVFNGLADGANSNNVDFDERKDVAVRVMLQPFRPARGTPWQGLLFGVGASQGRHHGPGGRTSGYRTDGQQTYFAYHSGVIADGDTMRLSPQLDYRLGGLGVMAEHVTARVHLRAAAGAPRQRLSHDGWQATAMYVLTGEPSSYTGLISATDFAPRTGTWGAVELVARYATADIDDAAFPQFATSPASASGTTALALGLNWHPSKAARFMFNFYQSRYDLRAAPSTAVPLLRQDEKAFVSRFQFSF